MAPRSSKRNKRFLWGVRTIHRETWGTNLIWRAILVLARFNQEDVGLRTPEHVVLVGMGLIFLVLFYSSSQARLGWMGVYEVAVLDPCLVGKETPDMTHQGRKQKIWENIFYSAVQKKSVEQASLMSRKQFGGEPSYLIWRTELLSCDHPKWKPAPRHALVRFFFLLYSSELRKRPVWQNSWQNKNGSHLPTPPSAHFLGLSTETVYVSFPSLSGNKGKTHSNCPLRLVLGTGRKNGKRGQRSPLKEKPEPTKKLSFHLLFSDTNKEWMREGTPSIFSYFFSSGTKFPPCRCVYL